MRGPVRELDTAVVEQLLHVNTLGAVYPTIAALPALLQSRGSVVFVSTLAAVHGFPGVSMYSAAKMAVTGFAQALHAEHARDGLHIGVAYLGFTENDPEKTVLSADGRPFQHRRRAQKTQAEAAEFLLRIWKRRKRTMVAVPSGRALMALNRIAPRLVDWFLARSGGRIHQVERE
jgi:NAD(P)-dependent dehydrogenase (short-subunit alcohol dehydrogenase family)